MSTSRSASRSARVYDSAVMATRGRIGAYVTHSLHDPRETTANARAAFLGRFEREVDPDGVLSPCERQRRAEAAKRAYFSRLAYRSAKARRARRGAAVVESEGDDA